MWWFLTGETTCDLPGPLTGKSGSISVLISRIGQAGVAAGKSRKLTGAGLRPDGLVHMDPHDRTERHRPAAVVAVAWHGDAENPPGHFV